MQKLRPHLSQDQFKILLKQASKEKFELIALIHQGELKVISGFRIIHDFAHGKHLYIDDLITKEDSRSKGYGKSMLDYLEKIAKDKNCVGLRLCSAIDRKNAHRFYEKHNWLAKSLAFKKRL